MLQAGLTWKLPSPALKEAERSGPYNLKRFEHPYEGNCTARHSARTHSGTSNARRALRLYAHRTYVEVAFSGIKGGGAFWTLQSKAL